MPRGRLHVYRAVRYRARRSPAGAAKVNLATMVEEFLGLGLSKGHGAASLVAPAAAPTGSCTRPRRGGSPRKDCAMPPLPPSPTPVRTIERVRSSPRCSPGPRLRLGRPRWRRTAASTPSKSARGLAAVRELWLTREVAQRRDIAPGRILPDFGDRHRRRPRTGHPSRPDAASGVRRPTASTQRPDLVRALERRGPCHCRTPRANRR